MKILRVVAHLYPSSVGGVELHAHEMSKKMAQLGHDVTIFTTAIGTDLKNEYANGYNIRRFKPLVKLLGNSITPAMFFEILVKKNDFDIIHAHSHLNFSTNLCALSRKMSSSPLVITNHGLKSQTAPAWLQNIYLKTVAKWTFGAADKIICYTETEKQELIDLGIKLNKIVVIHNGIDTDIFVPGKKGLQNFELLWIGRFIHGKGVDYLVDAFKLLISRHPGLKLLMVGRGPDRERIKAKIHVLKLDNCITIKDFVPNYEIVTLYQSCNIFILPSLEEGVPRTILEAMSCGIPVVCSNLPQLVDIVKDGGFLVPTKDPQTLAERISEILSNEIMARKMGQSGRENIKNNYSWKDSVEKTIRLYTELI